jgi:hypothetical protein
MAKVKLYGKKNLRTAAYNRSAAKYFLNLAESEVEGSFFSSQASIVFSAFTHEAFLNTLGAKIDKCWEGYEYSSPEEKLKRICKCLEYKPNKGTRPYQTLEKLFRFRNLIAHGREETLKVEGMIVSKKETGGYLDAIESEWEKYCTIENARKAYKDINDIAVDICEQAKIERFAGFPFGNPASGTFEVREHNI